MTRIVRGLSVFCESFSKCTFSFSYVLFLTSFAFYHINQVRRFARHLLFDFSYFPSVVKCIVCSFIINATLNMDVSLAHTLMGRGGGGGSWIVDVPFQTGLVAYAPINVKPAGGGGGGGGA